MPIGVLFWTVFLITLIFCGLAAFWPSAGWLGQWTGLVPFVLFGLLGWKTFRPAIKG